MVVVNFLWVLNPRMELIYICQHPVEARRDEGDATGTVLGIMNMTMS